MRVCHVINGLPTGGAETFVVELASQQRAAGHEVRLARLVPQGGEPYRTALARGLPVDDIGARGRTDLARMLQGATRLSRRCDVLHAHLYPAQLVVAFAGGASRRFATEHSTFYRRRRVAPIVALDRLMYRRFEAVVCISEAVRTAVDAAAPGLGQRLQVIPNGIDAQAFREATAAPRDALVAGADGRTRILINVARMVEAKDQDTLIRAVATLPTDVHLVLVGDGVRRPALERLVDELACRDRVHFLGERVAIAPLLRASDAFVLSSRWEGFGLSALEALAAGVPVVATANDGVTSWAAEHVRLTPPGDAAAMARTIRATLDLPPAERAAVVAAGQAFADTYALRRTAERYLQLYAAETGGA